MMSDETSEMTRPETLFGPDPAKQLALDPGDEGAVHVRGMAVGRELVDGHPVGAAPRLEDLDRLPGVPGACAVTRRTRLNPVIRQIAAAAIKSGVRHSHCEICASSRW